MAAGLTAFEKYLDSWRLNHPDFGNVRACPYTIGVITDFKKVSDDPIQVISQVKVQIEGMGESDYIPLFYHPKAKYWDCVDFIDGELYSIPAQTFQPLASKAPPWVSESKAQHNPAYSELLGLFQQDPKGFLERRGILVCDENRKGTEITFHCPLHDDSTASGHINKETGVWHCKAGCGAGNLITLKGRPETAEDAVHQLTELAKDEGIECAFEPASFYQTMIDKGCTYYDYHDEHGQVIYRKFRVEPKGKRKVFYPFMYDASSERFYTLDGKKFPELLYRYPKPETQIILLTEGEKDADNLAAVYKDEYPVILATTSGNADSWKDDFADCFHKGIRRVYIFPDNDKSGREYANKVSRSLAGRGIPYTIVDLQSEKDVSDYRDKYAGHHCWDAEHPLTLATEDPAVFLKIDGMPFRNWQEQQEALEAMI